MLLEVHGKILEARFCYGAEKKESGEYDVVFVIGSICISYLSTSVPVVLFSNSVFSSMVNYYWFDMKERELEEYNEIQRKALCNSDCVILTSRWARDAAVNDYKIEDNKLKGYHFGSNIELKTLAHEKHDDFNLLFIGVDLQRKGAEIAVKCTEICNKKDKTHHYVLHIIGGKKLEHEIKDNNIIQYGFIDRNVDSEREKLEYLRSISDVFILPTRAECVGIVFGEAAAYGIPSIAYNTGGVSDYIINEKTGYIIDLDCGAEAFAEKIIYLANHNDILNEMKKNAGELFEDDLNGGKLGESIHAEIEKILG